MEFALLGDVEVRSDGVAQDVGHVRQRAVLVALLLEEGQPVPVDRLLDRVWGERTPLRAKETLYGYISRLRRVAGVDIERSPGGYRLRASNVDVFRFRAHVRQGMFDEALALWRGEALAGLESPWLDSMRESLHAERIAAELARNDAALAAGRHAELLPSLRRDADARPLDERIAAQLILALHRSGNDADALRHYEHMRQALAEELGADPSPQLRELHQQILTASDVPVPRQLPAPHPWFTGRTTELAALAPNGTVVITAIGGTGGIGKTALAVHWAHQHLADFPDGQLYVNLRGFDPSSEPVPAHVALRGFLEALGEDPAAVPASLDARAGRYRSLVAGKRMLVVLDNARDTDQVVPLLPGGSTCTVLVTSRLKLPGLLAAHGARAVSLDVLEVADAVTFLSARLGAERVAAERSVVDELVAWCGGLPLALSIVAARAAMEPDFPLSVFADELREVRLDALDAGELNLRTVFSWSVAALSEPAARVFGQLGVVRTADVSLAAVAALADLPVTRTRMVLRELENAHLLQQHVPGRYRMHDLVGLYAADLGADFAAARRLEAFYAASARAAALVLEPHKPLPELESAHVVALSTASEAMAWFDAEHDCLMTAQRLAEPPAAWMLGRAMNNYHLRRGRTADDAEAWEVALTAATALGHPVNQATAHACLGADYVELGRSALGHQHFRQALDLHAGLGDHAAAGGVHRAIAWATEFEGDIETALKHSLLALEAFRLSGAEIREAEALNEVGWRYACLGRYAEARAYCDEGMLLNRKLGHREGLAATLDSLGHIAHHDGRQTDAVAHYREALALYRELDNSYEEATVLHHLGDVHAACGEVAEARERWARALELYEVQGRTSDAEAVRASL